MLSRLAIVATDMAYEPAVEMVMERVFNARHGAFLDVGANVGQMYLKLLKIDSEREYIGFEPQVEGAALISDFMRLNNLDHHIILPLGLSNENSIVEIGFNRSGDVTASIDARYRPSRFYRYKKFIPVFTGDYMLEKIGVNDISMIKIDVEGAELAVLEGFKRTLQSKVPVVSFEVLPNRIVSTGEPLTDDVLEYRNSKLVQLQRLFRDVDYQIVEVTAGGSLDLVQLDDDESLNWIGDVRNLIAGRESELERVF